MVPVVLEYIWIDGENNLRSKIKIHHGNDFYDINSINIESIPIWNFDGSSTKQATTDDSEVLLVPVKLYNNPFIRENSTSYLVLCSTYGKNNVPAINNNRERAVTIFDKYEQEEAWYGLEQEYFMIDNKTSLPLGFNPDIPQGKYYCAVGADRSPGRKLAEEHMDLCLFAGINISGINQEVAPGQWEFQIGPCFGLDVCDDLWIARYILAKLGEKYDIAINYAPKLLKGDWNGSGCHTNFSTKRTRNQNGLSVILECMEKLKDKHLEHIQVYGECNEDRLSGKHETSSMDTFSWSVGGRATSVRIGNETYADKRGYFEDRRPAANMDPYLVCPLILETCCCSNDV